MLLQNITWLSFKYL